jgi:anti-sigma regulatory factor (Ser/Thr protein kinase)
MGSSSEEARARREEVLRAAGAADPHVRGELLAYCENVFDASRLDALPPLPLPDEPHVTAWRGYAAEVEAAGSIEPLRRRLPQLQFGIAEGMSASEEYRLATRRGLFPAPGGDALALVRPEKVVLKIHPSPGGSVPVIVAAERADFVALVQAFSGRNEPIRVPDSMGACIVTGYNNWDRIHAYRRAWESANPGAGPDGWSAEFKAIVPRKELYEDRFIILSSGPYSDVGAGAAGFPPDEWLGHSLSIRLDHECTHYFTFRLLGVMRNNLLDELIADYAGIVATFGEYRTELALLFFGLEEYPRYRSGARLENYRGDPPLSDAAFEVLGRLVHDAVMSIGKGGGTAGGDAIARRVLRLASLTLEEIAGGALERSFATGGAPPLLSLRMPNRIEALGSVESAFRSWASGHRIGEKTVADVNVALDELLSNIVKYGYADAAEHEIDVRFHLAGDELELEIVDDGVEFDMLAREEPDVTLGIDERPIGGLGIHIVKKLTSSQSYERREGRNRTILVKRVAW